MKKIVLFGHGGSYNHGCEAIIRSTVDMLSKNKRDITLYTSSVSSDEEFLLDEIVSLKEQRRNFNKYNILDLIVMVLRKFLSYDKMYLIRFFKGKFNDCNSNIAISVGGDMYCYGELSWLYYIHDRLKANDNRTVLWGCSVNEDSFFEKSKNDLKKYDIILARESISYNLFKENGFDNVKLYPDPAFNLSMQTIELPEGLINDNTIAINISPLVKRYKQEFSLEENLKTLIEYVLSKTNYQILFLPHVNGTAVQEDDYTYLNKFRDIYNSDRIFILEKIYNACQIKYAISKCKMLITARTHASIAAYSTYVPTLVLGYSVKSIGIAKDIFGTDENYVLKVQSLKSNIELLNSFKWLEQNQENIKKHLIKIMPNYKEQALKAATEIINLIGD